MAYKHALPRVARTINLPAPIDAALRLFCDATRESATQTIVEALCMYLAPTGDAPRALIEVYKEAVAPKGVL